MSDLGRELAAGLDAVLADVLPIETLLAAAADDEPTDIRADLGALGLFSLALDESAGGFGLGPGDLAEVGVVAGARLLPVWAREATILQAPALAGLSESRAAVQALDTLVGGSGRGRADAWYPRVTAAQGLVRSGWSETRRWFPSSGRKAA